MYVFGCLMIYAKFTHPESPKRAYGTWLAQCPTLMTDKSKKNGDHHLSLPIKVVELTSYVVVCHAIYATMLELIA